ncbi:activity-dependent neuroprotector homeobox protein 2a [Alosa sapidissima]|uniref:activity-dependent neuroprotector homeobox protein 2a n=1 Tax=Alosa sapidissima TaxID=34773 RepID=UPI001C0A1147|nr:activity-dependent neuroprotector homeobox protein 2a [Alosa sapidissima]XP_041963771.1 activity-dependent neuroprotector homeobox protein 2a [Alosa sapidissima]
MYQNPVGDVEKLRNSRKRVKSILCDIGLDSCNDLVEEWKSFDTGEECFNDTEWDDLTEGYSSKRRKKWCYRSEKFCCNLCWFSTWSWYTFRGHVQRCHEEELDLASLSTCKNCHFVGHPSTTDHHIKLFHSTAKLRQKQDTTAASQKAEIKKAAPVVPNIQGDKYTCRSCGYHDSLLYVMKKHVLVNHYGSLLNRYFGHRNQDEKNSEGAMYYCKMCNLPAQTCEHLLYHILSSEKHKELEVHIKPFVCENVSVTKNGTKKKLQSLAPKAGQKTTNKTAVSVVAKPQHSSVVSPTSTASSSGTVLLAAPSNTTALLCTSGPRQVYIPSQASAKNILLSNAQTPARLPTPTVVKTGYSMFVPNLTSNTSKQVPSITVRVPGLPHTQPGQVLLPPGVRINVPGKMGLRPPQPLLVTHNLAMNQSNPQPPMLSSQSIRLIPTGNNVNGVPTYTLAPAVQVTVPVQPGGAQVVGKGPVVLTQNNVGTVQQLSTPIPPGVTGMSAEQKLALSKSKTHELAVLSPFLKSDNKTVRCLKCKILLTEKGIFHHLLHGLKCLFCPAMFYSVKQIMEHAYTEHSLSVKANRDFLKKEYQIDTSDQGNLVFTSFDLNTNIPKEQLGDKELNLVLVTGCLEKIFMKMYPESPKVVGTASAKHFCTGCPLCKVKILNKEDYDLHLKTKHHIMPTIHAILKTPAFKCIYCLGVYTEKFTSKTISIHVQRCRCAPKAVKDAERLINPDPNNQVSNGELTQPIVGDSALNHNLMPTGKKVNGVPTYTFAPIQLMTSVQPRNTQLLRKGQVVMVSKTKATKILGGKVVCKDSKLAQLKGRGRESSTPRGQAKSKGTEVKSQQVRKELLNKHFNQKPYLTEAEVETLAARLWLKRPDVVAAFSKKQNMCMKAINTKRTAVLLGFNMSEMKKVKHNVVIPETLPVNANVNVSVQTEVVVKTENDC